MSVDHMSDKKVLHLCSDLNKNLLNGSWLGGLKLVMEYAINKCCLQTSAMMEWLQRQLCGFNTSSIIERNIKNNVAQF